MKLSLHAVYEFFLYPVTEFGEVMFSGSLDQDLNL
jgi:hypothetical protein